MLHSIQKRNGMHRKNLFFFFFGTSEVSLLSLSILEGSSLLGVAECWLYRRGQEAPAYLNRCWSIVVKSLVPRQDPA